MKESQNKVTSQQAREHYSKWLRNRQALGTSRADGATLPKAVLPDYVFWPDDPSLDGYLPLKKQETDLVIGIPAWTNGAEAGGEDKIIIEWKRIEAEKYVSILTVLQPGPNEDTDPDVQITIPHFHFEDHATYIFRYWVVNELGEGGYSIAQTITVDKIAPHYGREPDALSFTEPEAENGDITQDYLDNHGDVLAVTIPAYDQPKAGDIVEVFIEGNVPDPAAIPVFTGDIFISPRVVNIPGSRIRRIPDGPLFVTYRLIDRIGNIGKDSKKKKSYLAIKPLPVAPLPAPGVPLAEDNNTLVDIADAQVGVSITIPLYTNWDPSDEIIVNWAGHKRAPFTVGTFPGNPIIIDVPYSLLKLGYGAGSIGDVPATVEYSIIRGSAEVESLQTTVNVNLWVPGPTNPNEPGPINPLLNLVTVQGGGVTPQDNKLLASDKGLDARAFLSLYSSPEVGQRLELFWGSLTEPVALYDITAANNGGDVVTFNIPWSEIEKEPGSSSIPVYYKIRLIAGGGGSNSQQSANQSVDVIGALPILLGEPQFPDKVMSSGTPPIASLSCKSYISDGGGDYYVRVKIPGNPTLLKAGDTVSITWQPYTDRAATLPVTSGKWELLNKILTKDEAANGFEIQVKPYLDHIEVVGSKGAVKVSYTGTPAGGSSIPGEATIYASSTRPGGGCIIFP